MGFTNNHTCVASGDSVLGPPWKAQQLLECRESLEKEQARSRAFIPRRAYQLTHDDIATAVRRFLSAQLGEALDSRYRLGTNPNVDWLKLEIALMATASFGSGCRGAEMVSIRLGDLVFLSEETDATIGTTLYGVKSKKGCRTIRRVIFPSWKDTMVISPAFAIMTQIALVHGSSSSDYSSSSPLFPNVHRNQIQRGQLMGSDTYSAALKEMFKDLGITDEVTEHSPRRGGSGFRYYVLGEHPDYIRDILGQKRHVSIMETLTYIGFSDKSNSYVSQGYGTCGAKNLR